MKYRYLYKTIKDHLKHKNYSILTGARQVGKTSILRNLFFELRDDGHPVVLLNLEDKEILNVINKNSNSIFDYLSVKPKKIIDGITNNRIYILIDEIQYLDNPSNFLKFMYDEYEYNVKYIVTGSSAFYIDRKFKDSLAGRKRIFRLHPLSFNEFLIFKKEEVVMSEIENIVREPYYKSSYRRSMLSYLNEYLTYGGYPAVVLEDDHEEKLLLLKELKNSYLKKDISESGVDKEAKFYILLQLLSDQVGNLVNKNELGNTIGLDNKTIEKYLYIMNKSFHVGIVRPFHRNIRKELTKMPKVYFNDIGLRNALIGNFDLVINRLDKGALLENFVYNQLRIKHDSDMIRYWRTADGNEVDFVIEPRFNSGYALEVKWECSKFRPSKYKKFKNTYDDKFPLSCIDRNNAEILIY